MTRLRKKYGNEWFGLPRKEKGKATEFQNEIRGLSSIIWYSTECNWFEYKSGSALHYFRFPISYQGIDKDGVPVFFEKEGPRTMCPQPLPMMKGLELSCGPKLERSSNGVSFWFWHSSEISH